MPWQTPLWRSKPASYISHLLGHEGAGSLLSALKREGLDVETWWHLITNQIDRMHQLELLFAAELRTNRTLLGRDRITLLGLRSDPLLGDADSTFVGLAIDPIGNRYPQHERGNPA